MRGARLILAIAGLVAMLVGAAEMIAPVAFRESAGIEIERTASALSEVRAPGGALLAVGILILYGGAIRTIHRRTAALASTVAYLSFGCARVLGIVLDGWPDDSLVIAMVAELALGMASLWVLRRSPS